MLGITLVLYSLTQRQITLEALNSIQQLLSDSFFHLLCNSASKKIVFQYTRVHTHNVRPLHISKNISVRLVIYAELGRGLFPTNKNNNKDNVMLNTYYSCSHHFQSDFQVLHFFTPTLSCLFNRHSHFLKNRTSCCTL